MAVYPVAVFNAKTAIYTAVGSSAKLAIIPDSRFQCQNGYTHDCRIHCRNGYIPGIRFSATMAYTYGCRIHCENYYIPVAVFNAKMAIYTATASNAKMAIIVSVSRFQCLNSYIHGCHQCRNSYMYIPGSRFQCQKLLHTPGCQVNCRNGYTSGSRFKEDNSKCVKMEIII